MGQLQPHESNGPNLIEGLNGGEEEILKSAVSKLVAWGEQLGVGADQMVQLLESGLSVAELLEYLIMRNRAVR
jgi:hypothetical protein